MKLIITIVAKDDAPRVIRELVSKKYFVTKLASSGGFLRNGNTTLMIGIADSEVDHAIAIITEFSKNRREFVPNSIVSEFGMISAVPIEVNVGGATMFVVDVEKFIKA
ncbi:MAG: cyclic-di-AMP receptor [Bacilli bacterium]